jgi:peptidoglycan/xylan/chitin deacetylase (PgdA/CDA1 family)
VEEVIGRAYAAAEPSHTKAGNGNGNAGNGDEGEEETTYTPPKYFRPGSGLFNKEMRALVKRLGYRLVLGNIYPHDAQIPYWWLNARHILSMLRPGSIIICHDRRSWTVPMLKKVLPEMARKGWKVVTLSELLEAAREE